MHIIFVFLVTFNYNGVVLGYDKSEVDRLLLEGKLVKEKSERLSISQSVSSLDRDDDSSDTFKRVSPLYLYNYS